MNRGLDAKWFVVHELVAGSAIPSKREYPTEAAARDEIRTRLYDDLADSAVDVGGPLSRDFREAVAALDAGALDVSWRGTRYWVSEEHEETGW